LRYEESTSQLYEGFNAFYRCFVAEPQRGVVVDVHGFCEHSGRYADFGRFLAENGFTFCMYDLRGHGRSAAAMTGGSPGAFELFVRDVGALIEFASRRYGAESVHFLGHSMGGLIAVYYRNDREGLRTLMTSGAAVYLAPPPLSQRLGMSLLSALRPRARVQLPIDPRELSIDESVGKAYMEDQLVAKDPTARLIYELYRGLREVWRYVNRVTVLMLILHGKDDRVVSPEASERLYRAIQSKDKRLITFEGMKREILSERIKAAAYKEVLGWLSSH